MSYTKQTWSDTASSGTPITAARMNHMEDGIKAANDAWDSVSHRSDKGWQIERIGNWCALATTVTLRTGQATNIECITATVQLPVSLASYAVTATLSTASLPSSYVGYFDVSILVASKSSSSFALGLMRGYDSFLPVNGTWTVDLNVVGAST